VLSLKYFHGEHALASSSSVTLFLLESEIKLISSDVTNEDEVVRTHAEICSIMPPIGGVAQGASKSDYDKSIILSEHHTESVFYLSLVVLDDNSITEMTMDQLLRATRPKVEGSIHLNNLFKKNTLDFFIFFSSASAVVGHSGQSNYSAANLFMAGLAEQRHQRGLAASIINIGPVVGVGYLAQQEIDVRRHFSREGMLISERDFHQLFAEAVIAGRPGGPGPIEITTGLARVGLHDQVQPAWASNPTMSHYIRIDYGTELTTNHAKLNVPIKTQLSQAHDRAEVFNIIKDAFTTKLSALYQLPVEFLAEEDAFNLQLNNMGTDSLLATELRGWFVKTLEVNIPVLQILGGISVGELLDIAIKTIPSSLIPCVSTDDASSLALEAPKSPENEHLPLDSPTETDDGQGFEILGNVDGKSETQPSSVFSGVDSGDWNHDFKHEGQILNFQKKAKLSFSQSMFWFVLSFLQENSSLNHTGSFRLTGRIRHEDFEHALQSIGQQHEILRACFFEQDGQPRQGFLESSAVRGEYRQIHNESEVAHVVEELETHRFDISHGETMKVILLSLSPMTHFLVMSSHSLVMDGLSFRVFMRDLQRHYTRVHQIHETPQYLDYSIKQYLNYDMGKYDEDLRFWKAEFADFPDPLPILTLGKVATRPALKIYENERADIRLGPKMKTRILTLCRRSGVTPFHFYLTVFRALLVRYTDAEDVSIGIADANRTEENMDSIGPFVNLIPLRFRAKGAAKFETLLKETQSTSLAALAHAKIPFQVLLNE
jgi:hybrid polyketide synthase/nonribosomal peptide synthetase ACE1